MKHRMLETSQAHFKERSDKARLMYNSLIVVKTSVFPLLAACVFSLTAVKRNEG